MIDKFNSLEISRFLDFKFSLSLLLLRNCQYNFLLGESENSAKKSVNQHPSVDSLTKQAEDGWSPAESTGVPVGSKIP